ncbi:putative pyridoxal kinase [Xylographa trunciseda]|nr:putative pyridoxal kinase [Xylographa trunciseda]
MAAFVMQALGCEVAAINTVQFSNHAAYGQFAGTRTSAAEIAALYDNLVANQLARFDVLLSGFAPSAAAVEAVGAIGRALRTASVGKPGSFFWGGVLDPVMGDAGSWYVDADVLPVYKALLPHADLLLPNVFELEVLSGTKIHSLGALAAAVTELHSLYQIPHIVVTSVRFAEASPSITVIGSSKRVDGTPRLFRIDVPALDCFFSGTGDLFAALTIVRLREATVAARLEARSSWLSSDDVCAIELPLAKAVEKVLASMQQVLVKTKAAVDMAVENVEQEGPERGGEWERIQHLKKTRAAEVRIVRHLKDLREPKVVFRAVPLDSASEY